MIISRLTGLGAALALTLSSVCLAGGVDSLVPKPTSLKELPGNFTLEEDTLKAHNQAGDLSQLASDYLALRLGRIGIDLEGGASDEAQIFFIATKAEQIAAEAYQLEVSPEQIRILASSKSGFLYGVMTLLQLGPDEVWNTDPKPASFSAPAVQISDAPRLAMRGLMLDVSRQFYPKKFVLELLDLLAQHKINTFHWHLTDDEGWRIEIKAYPKLTTIGAERGPGTKLPFSILPAIHGPKDKVQRGFYTQEEIREVVQRAAELGITVIPEIDIPGHCKAAIVAYPELLQDPNDKSRYRSVQGTPNNTLDAGLESTYEFVDKVIAEVAELFPSTFIHVGGDERPGGAWEKSPAAQAMMKKEGLKNTNELQSYFFRRVEAILKKYDKRLLGWQEVAYGGDLSRKDSAIMAWHDVGRAMKEVERQDIDVVLAPASQAYFDLKYERRKDEPGLVWAGTTDTKDAYSYRPLAGKMTQKQKDHILGAIACLWSETIISLERADYMLWPRVCAFSEVCWSQPEGRSWDEFNERLHARHLPRLERQEVAYRVPQPSAKMVGSDVVITPPFPSADVHYSLDGTDPTIDSPQYREPIAIGPNDQLKFATFTPNSRHSRIVSDYEKPPVATWNPAITPADWKEVTLPLQTALRGPGTYEFTFIYERGKFAIDIENVSLIQSAKALGNDAHTAFVGGKMTNNVFRIDAPEAVAGQPASLLVKMKGNEGTESTGRVEMRFYPLRASRKVTAAQPPSDEKYAAAMGSDGDAKTVYRSKGPAVADDHFTILFDKPQTATQAFVSTGFPDGKEQAISGVLETTEDGETWKEVGRIQFGAVSVKFENPISLKGLRLRIDQKQETPLVVQELDIQ